MARMAGSAGNKRSACSTSFFDIFQSERPPRPHMIPRQGLHGNRCHLVQRTTASQLPGGQENTATNSGIDVPGKPQRSAFRGLGGVADNQVQGDPGNDRQIGLARRLHGYELSRCQPPHVTNRHPDGGQRR
jgi:hypothetical protein